MFKKIIFLSITAIIVFSVWTLLTPTKIVRVDGGLVYLENLPLTTKGKIKWWNEHKNALQEKYHLIDNENNINVTLMKVSGYKRLPTGSNDGSMEDYNCYADIKSNEKCIYKDVAMRIGGSYSKKIFYSIDNKLYSQSSDGKITQLEK